MTFWANVLDANDNIIGDGPITSIVKLNDTARLDAIDEASFEIPAADRQGDLIQAGRKFDLYDDVDGYIGRFLYKSRQVSESIGKAMVTISLYGSTKELSRESVYFRRNYINQPVDVVVEALVALKAGWTASAEAGIGNTSISFEGESILIGIDALRDRWGKHYRLLPPRTLEFGSFGEVSGVRLTNLQGQMQAEITAHPEIAIVDSIRLVEDAEDQIFNRIVPLGAGQGVSQLTIEQATAGIYTVQVGTNADGSFFYYIEDETSVSTYGRVVKILSFPNIRPITNSDVNIVNAANALKLTAEAYIQNHLSPKTTYDVSVRGLRRIIRPGDTVRMIYKGMVDGYTYIDVDEDFYVMDVARSRSINGDRSAKLTISTTSERRTADSDVMIDVISDLKALKVHVPITLAYSPIGPYSRGLGPSYPAQFVARIADEVTFLNYAILRFKTSPLRSNVSGSASGGSSTPTTSSGGGSTPTSSSGGSSTPTTSSGGGSTPTSSSQSNHSHTITLYGGPRTYSTKVHFDYSNHQFHLPDVGAGSDDAATSSSGGSHSHTVTIDPHTHTVNIDPHTHTVTIDPHTHTVTIGTHIHTLTYGFYDDTNYPQTINCKINGVDVTAALGGPWALTNAGIDLEKDITDYLVNAVGGLRQNHTIEFSCTGGKGEIEVEIDMLVSIQSIAVS